MTGSGQPVVDGDVTEPTVSLAGSGNAADDAPHRSIITPSPTVRTHGAWFPRSPRGNHGRRCLATSGDAQFCTISMTKGINR